MIEGEIAAGLVNSCGFHSNTCIPEVAFKAVSFSAKVSFSLWILDFFPRLFSVSISPSFFYRVSIASFPKTLKKTQVFLILNVSPFQSTFPEATALSPPPHTQSFSVIFYPCCLHMLPSHLLLNSLHSVFHLHYKLQKASVTSGDFSVAKVQGQFQSSLCLKCQQWWWLLPLSLIIWVSGFHNHLVFLSPPWLFLYFLCRALLSIQHARVPTVSKGHFLTSSPSPPPSKTSPNPVTSGPLDLFILFTRSVFTPFTVESCSSHLQNKERNLSKVIQFIKGH